MPLDSEQYMTTFPQMSSDIISSSFFSWVFLAIIGYSSLQE